MRMTSGGMRPPPPPGGQRRATGAGRPGSYSRRPVDVILPENPRLQHETTCRTAAQERRQADGRTAGNPPRTRREGRLRPGGGSRRAGSLGLGSGDAERRGKTGLVPVAPPPIKWGRLAPEVAVDGWPRGLALWASWPRCAATDL